MGKRVARVEYRDEANLVPLRLRGATLKVVETIAKAGIPQSDIPDEFLKRSREKGSPTHDLFEWNDARAAHMFRVNRANAIVGSIEIVFEGETRTRVETSTPKIRIAQSDERKKGPKRLSEADVTAALVMRAKADAEAWASKHEALREHAELQPLFMAVDQLLHADEYMHKDDKRRVGK